MRGIQKAGQNMAKEQLDRRGFRYNNDYVQHSELQWLEKVVDDIEKYKNGEGEAGLAEIVGVSWGRDVGKNDNVEVALKERKNVGKKVESVKEESGRVNKKLKF